jgi:hypothetical protein
VGLLASRLPPDSTVISATMTFRIASVAPPVPGCRIVVYRLATVWRPGTATYNSPWSAPGLIAGVDYESVPVERITLPEQGLMTLDLTQAIVGWQRRGRLGGGLVLMLSDDSPSQCQYWVYLTEQSDLADRPTLRITYKAPP